MVIALSNQTAFVMNPEIQINVRLEPIVDRDRETGHYMVFFKQFPQATGLGRSEKEAIANLEDIFKIMLSERANEIKEQILKAHFGSLQITHLNLIPANA